MNALFYFVAGASICWATNKLYHAFSSTKKNDEVTAEKALTNEPATGNATKSATESTTKKESVANEVKTKAKEVTTKKKTKKKIEKSKDKKVVPKNKESPPLKEKQVDDLSQLKGVGPKLAEALDEIGIYNYEQLSNPSLDLLLIRLKETGGRFSRPAITAVVERAKAASKER